MLGHHSRLLLLVDRHDLVKLLVRIVLHARDLGFHHLTVLAGPGVQQGPHGLDLCVFQGDFFAHKRDFLYEALHELGLKDLVSGVERDLHVAVVE